MLSSGLFGKSQLVLIKFDFETCEFNEIEVKGIDDELFGEGIAVMSDGTIF